MNKFKIIGLALSIIILQQAYVQEAIPSKLFIEPKQEDSLVFNEGKLDGAIQMGVHEFYIAEAGKDLPHTVNGKFKHPGYQRMDMEALQGAELRPQQHRE